MTYQNSRTDNILQKSSNEAKHNITQRTKYVNEIYHDEYEMIKIKKLKTETHRIKSIYPQQINSIILNQLNKVSSNEMGNNQSNKPKLQTYLNTQTHIWSKSQTTPNP